MSTPEDSSQHNQSFDEKISQLISEFEQDLLNELDQTSADAIVSAPMSEQKLLKQQPSQSIQKTDESIPTDEV